MQHIVLSDLKDTDDIVKKTALKFLGDEPNVHQQFLTDLTFPAPPAPATEILFEMLAHLRDFSQFYYGVFASLVAAYIFHRIRHKRDSEKLQSELEEKFRNILKEHKDEITSHINRNRDLEKRFKKVDFKKHYIRYTPGMKEKWEIRLKIYGEGAELFLDSEGASKRIIEILNQITWYDSDKPEK